MTRMATPDRQKNAFRRFAGLALVFVAGASSTAVAGQSGARDAGAALEACLSATALPQDQRATILAGAGFVPDANPSETHLNYARQVAVWRGRTAETAEASARRIADRFVDELAPQDILVVRAGVSIRVGPVEQVSFPSGTFPAVRCTATGAGELRLRNMDRLFSSVDFPINVITRRDDAGLAYLAGGGETATGLYDLTVIGMNFDGRPQPDGAEPVWSMTLNYRSLPLN